MKPNQMRRKSSNSSGVDPNAFTEDAANSSLLSLEKVSPVSSWRILLRSKMISRSSSSSTCLGIFLLLSVFLGEIGISLGAANPPSSTTTDLPSILDRVGLSSHHGHHHKCYVCLPPDKSSPEAQDILNLFKDESGGSDNKVKDCAGFASSVNREAYEYKCPTGYHGCLLRIHGANVSRSCAQFEFNECKVANSKELCFCKGSLCNGEKASISPEGGLSVPLSRSAGESTSSEERSRDTLLDEQEESESRKFWQKGETDDEDLLEMADDTGSGNGNEPYPPGVIDAYVTTPKPTLVPNIRGDKPKTTLPPPTSGSATVGVSPVLGCLLVILSLQLVNQYERP